MARPRRPSICGIVAWTSPAIPLPAPLVGIESSRVMPPKVMLVVAIFSFSACDCSKDRTEAAARWRRYRAFFYGSYFSLASGIIFSPALRPQRPSSFPGRLFAIQSFARPAPCRLFCRPFRPHFARKQGSPATEGPGLLREFSFLVRPLRLTGAAPSLQR
jgi:hypothetical protein